MEPFRKQIGLLVLVFLGVPSLTAVLWLAGITQAVTSPDFIPNLPKDFSEELPDAVEFMLESARHRSSIEPENLRQWILAASKAETRPGELFEEIGLMSWLRDDLSDALKRIYLILQGEVRPHNVKLDFTGLKTAFHHEAIDRYFLEIVDQLPPATEKQEQIWYAIGSGQRHYRGYRQGLPACKPSSQEAIQAVADKLRDRDENIPRRETIFEGEEIEASGIDILTIARILGYLLLMIPGFIIAFGAFIAEPLNFRCFRWSGIPIIISSFIALVFAFLPKVLLKLMALVFGWIGSVYHDDSIWSPSLISQGIDKLGNLVRVVIDPLFAPVVSVALFAGLFGVLLYGLSCLSERRAPSRY